MVLIISPNKRTERYSSADETFPVTHAYRCIWNKSACSLCLNSTDLLRFPVPYHFRILAFFGTEDRFLYNTNVCTYVCRNDRFS